jgi:transposase-like protein
MVDFFKGQDLVKFIERFPNDDACKQYLFDLKFNEGFVCPKCGHTEAWDNSKEYTKVCKGCRHPESATANTLFHKVKFGLQKAFIICFEMTSTSKGISSIQMAKRVGVKQKTAWYFMHKVRKAMESSGQHPMEGDVEVDEFVVGGMEGAKPGRSYDTRKKKAAIAVELNPKRKVKRVYINHMPDYSAKSIKPLFEQHISHNANVRTDGWTAYAALSKDWRITQEKSSHGMNFKELHVIISQVKSWLRCIPTHVHKKYIQHYFNEYCFRINRSLFKETIFHKLIERMIAYKTISCPIINNA